MNKQGVSEDNINFKFPYYVLVYVLRGKGSFTDSTGKEYSLEAGDIFQRLPDQIHSNFIDPASNWLECFFDIGTSYYNAFIDSNFILNQPVIKGVGLDMSIISKSWELLQKLKVCEEDELSQCLISFMTILQNIMKLANSKEENDDSPSIIEQACKYLSKSSLENVNFKTFCSLNGLGYEKYRKIFQQKIGISPGQYRIRRRLDAGCQMLNTNNLSIAEIADNLGYSSPYEFSAQFKKHFGMSPIHYRNGIDPKTT